MLTEAGGALLVGVLGSLHCAGMCGPLAIAVAAGQPAESLRRTGLFLAGKASVYVALGAAAGTVGAAFGGKMGARGLAVAAILAGVVMIGMGLGSWLRRSVGARDCAAPAAPVTVLLKPRLRRPGRGAAFVAGVLAGLIPCGLVYSMAAQSMALGGVIAGTVLMLAFAIGTAPSLLAAAQIGRMLGARRGVIGERIAAVAVMAMGVIAVVRGVLVLAQRSCCHH